MKSYFEFLKEDVPKFSADFIFDRIDWQSSYDDLYPGYSMDEYEVDDTYFYTKEQALNYVGIVNSVFGSLPNPIPIYRSVYISSGNESDIDLDDPGIYWSMYKDSAIQFGSHIDANFLMSAEVDHSGVDWSQTIKTYNEFSGGDDIDDENEITIADESAIKNIKIERLKWKRK